MGISRIAPLCLASLLPSAAQELSCIAQAPNVPVIRAVGFAELVGDAVITCTGGTPTPAGAPIPQLTLTLRSPVVDITSKVLTTSGGVSWSEALLFVDEPASGAWFPCEDESGICPATGNGTGAPTYGAGATDHRNIFQARQTAGALTWIIPFDPPGATASRIIRLGNVRVNANQTGTEVRVQTPIDVIVSAPPFLPFTRMTVAVAQRVALATQAALTWQPSGRVTAEPLSTIVLSNTQGSDWRQRTPASPPVNGATMPEPAPSESIGAPHRSESGYFNPRLPAIPGRGDLGSAGLADHGTRIIARITGVPPGARIFVPTRIGLYLPTRFITSPPPPSGYALLTATDAFGAGPFSAIPGGSSNLAPVNIVDGSGAAVWEIAKSSGSDRLNLAVFASYPPGSFPQGSLTVELGPSASQDSGPVPRFAAVGGAPANCTTQVVPVTSSLPTAGGYFEFNVATGPGCVWAARTNAPWITVTGAIQGSGRARLRVPFNAGPPRSTDVVIAGRPFQVQQSGGTLALAAPVATGPSLWSSNPASGVHFSWSPMSGATGYDLRIVSGDLFTPVYEGTLAGSGTSTLIDVAHPDPALPGPTLRLYAFFVRACSGGFTDATCGPFGSVWFHRESRAPFVRPQITAPASNQVFTTSTVEFQWQPVADAESVKVVLRRGSEIALQQRVPASETFLIYTMPAGQYDLRMHACSTVCDEFRAYPGQNAVAFQVVSPPVPAGAPTITQATLTGSQLSAAWTSVPGADAYRIQVVQPNTGPGGGALTVASRQTTLTNATLTLPTGPASVFVQACNGNGCGAFSPPTAITVAGPNPTAPVIGTPLTGISTGGPGVLFTWSRVPGDNGSNTTYRLYVADLSRYSAQAADIYTNSNFAGVQLASEGRRYDAVVVANPGPSQVIGPAAGFQVLGASPQSPTLTTPAHRSTIKQGNVQIGWTPVATTGLQQVYQYYVAVRGQPTPVATGVAPGLFVQVPLAAIGGATTEYSAIVRACINASADTDCRANTDAGWGPWSNAAGGPGVTDFTVIP